MNILGKNNSLNGWQRIGLLFLYSYILGALFWLIYLANTGGFNGYPTEESLNDKWAAQYINTIKNKLGEDSLKEEDWGYDSIGKPYAGRGSRFNYQDLSDSEIIISEIRKKYKNEITQSDLELNDFGYNNAKKYLPLKQALYILIPLGLFLLVPISVYIGFTLIRYLFIWIRDGFKFN